MLRGVRGSSPRSGINPPPALAGGFFITELAGKPQNDIFKSQICSHHATFIFWVFLFVFLYLNVLLCLHHIPLHCYKVLHDMTAAYHLFPTKHSSSFKSLSESSEKVDENIGSCIIMDYVLLLKWL